MVGFLSQFFLKTHRKSRQQHFLEKNVSYGLGVLVYGLEFPLCCVGTKATQKGRFDSELAYFSSNFLYVADWWWWWCASRGGGAEE